MKWLLVFLGGGTGSVLRFALSLFFQRYALAFPLATLVSNLIAAIFIGILAVTMMKSSSNSWLFFATGFCGGLSTFSTFSLETVQLFRVGNTALASLNVAFSVVLSIAVVYFIVKTFPASAS